MVCKVQIGTDGDPSKGQTDFSDSISLDIVDGLAICCAGFASERMFGVLLSVRAGSLTGTARKRFSNQFPKYNGQPTNARATVAPGEY